MAFLSLTSDFIFRTLFTRSPDLLIDLTNSILQLPFEKKIIKINILNPEIPREYITDKMSILDIKAEDSSGRLFNIEMQAFSQGYFVKRALYYWAKLFTSQLTQGNKYDRLNQVYSINFINFKLIENNSFHSVFQLLEINNPNILLSEDLEIHFLELPKFDISINDLKNDLDIWLYVLKNANKLEDTDMRIIVDKSPRMKKAFKELGKLSIDKELLSEYELRRKAELDYNSTLADQYEKGIARSKIETAQKMKEHGESTEKIELYTGLSKEEIKKL